MRMKEQYVMCWFTLFSQTINNHYKLIIKIMAPPQHLSIQQFILMYFFYYLLCWSDPSCISLSSSWLGFAWTDLFLFIWRSTGTLVTTSHVECIEFWETETEIERWVISIMRFGQLALVSFKTEVFLARCSVTHSCTASHHETNGEVLHSAKGGIQIRISRHKEAPDKQLW